MIDFESLVTLEERVSAGAAIRDRRADHRLYDLIQKTCDARRAELLTLKEKDLNPLLKMRTLMFRGKLREAKKFLAQPRGDERHELELLLEKARILAYEGEWQECDDTCTEAIDTSQSVPVSLLSLLQVRALARSELGRTLEALADLDTADSLIEVFPGAQSGFYCKTLRIRLRAKSAGTAEARARAFQELWALASAMADQDELNADYLLSLLMTEVELRRLHGACIADAAAACFRLSELMGDRLYAALALANVLSCGDAELRAGWQARKENDASEFVRLRKLWNDLDSREPSAEGVRAMKKQPCGRDHVCLDTRTFDRAVNAQWLFLPALCASVTLAPWSVQKLAKGGRNAQILGALENRAIPRAALFQSVWKFKYVPHLHDSLIWTTLDRFADRFQLPIDNRKTGIDIPYVWVVSGHR